ncbi:MAG: phenylalanyl-tRNA synthetase beta chain [Parcubacteria group bacterium Athens0714_26]|nr:MAG: phenylalanyl-tRNA synthetase beta chain [Parcubacteria group bacterium Athens1014_26]TSD03250.1 MAG: phenylalanyl-tRNA synthetase beta chain [Parcubacteria group bacterium Athens0714_26]
MKFSYNLIKKIAPGKYTKESLVEKLNKHSFEAVEVGGDILEIAVPPNRYSDASSHLGIAREASAIFNSKYEDPLVKPLKFDFKDTGLFKINNKEKKLCPRYMATYATNVKIGPSPKWLKDVLETCGLRPINNVVDIMNYVMLETGQPLHAFDADKIKGGIIVRRAAEKEKFETIDEKQYVLNKNILVIADDERPLAIAGIKGGKSSEVSMKTRHILVEAANFDGAGIYKSSRQLNLATDASVRFAHNLAPELAEIGMKRALALLKELAGVKIYKTDDDYAKKPSKEIIKADIKKLESIIGINLKQSDVANILKKLGFVNEKKLWVVPPLRKDVSSIEDITEEVARFKDYNKLPYVPPHIALGVAEEEESFSLKDKIRKFFAGAGFSEVYNYSFVSDDDIGAAPADVFGNKERVALSNPLSANYTCLRDSLAPGLFRNLKDNLRFYGEIRIFEIGKIFGKTQDKSNSLKETSVLGVAIVSKNSFLEIKGLIDGLFEQLGVDDYFMPELNLASKSLKSGGALRIEIDHHVVGYSGLIKDIDNAAVMELDLEKILDAVSGEKEYRAPSKYPSIMRDLSVLVSREARVGEILFLIQNTNIHLIEDVELVDFYEDDKLGDNNKSLTFRIIFQADDRTLTDTEVDKEMGKVVAALEENFSAEVR